ncbi:hypothetical protein M405DRAFT_94961 [Rhizopogon salebrosus TDB-379]|nr:hypothetical protein M405DRAFT_94961 [Rhizopogon salebrosus TDB-379]
MVLFQALQPITLLPECSEGPAKSSRLICVKLFLCTRWILWCTVSLCRRKTETRRVCYVRSAEGPGECLVDGKRQWLSLSYRPFWRDASHCGRNKHGDEYLSERPAASVWTCQADTVSVHWTKLSYVGMVTSHDLLFVGYYDIARSLYNS